ncbi:tetratricopeptide repeat-containing sulfotransferase family protein [Marinibactrum halimedae]|uniref:Sulfotransferase family protein n=1 Tax=Marinibactrum halimedae TaxID=1444977 RepID=A0AA37T6A0_9GAMM|nr:sulfotransferase [Marinibactrum halimedae]MCD9458511.1 sulfotransferase [Marinibactrum halimedae]GLS26626.1 hypothetical protein GCM10007877_23420 [Marinibactrum halimedae]
MFTLNELPTPLSMSALITQQLLENAEQALHEKDYRLAHELCLKALKQDSNNSQAHFLLAMNAMERREFKKAKTLLTVACRNHPNNADYALQLARLYTLLNLNTDAKAVCQTLIQNVSLNDLNGWQSDTLGVLLSRLNQHNEAHPYFFHAVTMCPENSEYRYNLGSNERFLGNFNSAIHHFQHIIEHTPTFYKAYLPITELRKATQDNHLIDKIQCVLPSFETSSDAHLHLCHSLAREFEALHQFSKAFYWWKTGNDEKRKTLPYHIHQDIALFNAVKKRTPSLMTPISGSHLVKTSSPQNNGPIPLFIIGLPRSGTTLLERMLSNHERIESFGELQDFPIAVKTLSQTPSSVVMDEATIFASQSLPPEKLRNEYYRRIQHHISNLPPSCQYFIDKLPLNFFNADLIAKTWPEAKILIMLRDPLDVCLGNFKQLFSVNFSYYNYSYDITDCAKYITAFRDLISHWQNIIPEHQVTTIEYENLVQAPEKHIKAITQFLQLPWQEQCLDFEKNQQPVSTASAVQVRKPLYKNAIRAWKKYSNELKPAINILNNAKLTQQ